MPDPWTLLINLSAGGALLKLLEYFVIPRTKKLDVQAGFLQKVLDDNTALRAHLVLLEARYDEIRHANERLQDQLNALEDQTHDQIRVLEERCAALEAHVSDWYAAIAAEPPDVQDRVKRRLKTARPSFPAAGA